MELITETSQWLVQNMTEFVLPFILILSLLVFIHEWGHYIVARICGVRVEVFSIGFGKELFGYTDKSSGTRWKFCLIPLGGYVKMFGDVDPASAQHSEEVQIPVEGSDAVGKEEDVETRPMTEEEKKGAFFAKSVGRRAAIVFAGPAINFLFALMAFTFIFAYEGRTITPPIAAAIVKGGAADSYGMKPHDILLNVNGRDMERFADIQRQVMVNLDQGMDIFILREGEEIKHSIVRPNKIEVEDRHGFKHSRGMLGILAPGSRFALDDMTMIAGLDVSTMDVAQKRDVFIDNLDTVFEIVVGPEMDDPQIYIINPRRADNADLIAGEDMIPTLHALDMDDIKNYNVW